nr:hypothetical protein B0A51_02500 [Rachicladosporium sp. CCFEE 5018]
MASSTYTQDFWEILLNVHLALLTIAIILAICVGVVHWTENKLSAFNTQRSSLSLRFVDTMPELEPIHRRQFGLIRLALMFVGTDMLVWSQIMLRDGLAPKDEAWRSTIRTLEGCGLALGAMLVGQVVTGVGYLLVDCYRRRRQAARDVEQQQEDAIVTELMEERGSCVRCKRPEEKVES